MGSELTDDDRQPTAPLAHVKVLELGSLLAAPFTSRLLSDFGAWVVKIEDPRRGDQGRVWGPFTDDGTSLLFVRANASKKSVGIDLRVERGRELVRAMVPQFDVVVENFRPGRLDQWGLGYEQLRALHPGVILVSLSAFGQTGRNAGRPGFGTIADAYSGFAHVNGWPDTPPTLAPFGLADQLAALAGAYGALVALAQRDQTGLGDHVDVALYEPMMVMMGEMITRYSASGEVQGRVGNGGAAASPRGLFQTGDGEWIAIAGSAQSIAERVFHAIGRPELITDPRFATNEARVENDEALAEIVAAWAAGLTRDEALGVLDAHEVAADRVNTGRDLVENADLRERGTIVEMIGERLKGLAVPGAMVRLLGHPGPEYGDPPLVGEHTGEILSQYLGLDAAELGRLAAEGVIGGTGSALPDVDPVGE